MTFAFRFHSGRSLARRLSIPLTALVAVVWVLPDSAAALPFDPVPSAFQRWLNAVSPGLPALPVTVSDLGQCVDNTQPSSPYRTAAYTCLKGVVTLRSDASRRCALDRIVYAPAQQQLRLWPVRACGSSDEIPRSIVLRNRAPLPPVRSI
ncbi:MAG: hypothetical protein ACKOCM_12505 [Cyanobacteriota bacterium]